MVHCVKRNGLKLLLVIYTNRYNYLFAKLSCSVNWDDDYEGCGQKWAWHILLHCVLTTVEGQIHDFVHSIGMCRMWWFLAVLRSFFRSSLLCTFSCHPSPPAIFPSSLSSSCHLFRGLPLSLVVPRFIYNTLLGILLASILCTCPKHNLFNLTVYVMDQNGLKLNGTHQYIYYNQHYAHDWSG